jgi:hypothetical protein
MKDPGTNRVRFTSYVGIGVSRDGTLVINDNVVFGNWKLASNVSEAMVILTAAFVRVASWSPSGSGPGFQTGLRNWRDASLLSSFLH